MHHHLSRTLPRLLSPAVAPGRALRLASALVLLASMTLVLVAPEPARAATQPASVTVAGDMQSELGCSGDWQPDCTVTHLTLNSGDGIWRGSFALPAGQWQYKVALNDGWTENYGAHATLNGANITLSLAAPATVTFYYDNTSHWATDNHTSVIVTAAGSFQSELGCSGDWDPSCLRSWPQDIDGDGTYTFATTVIPAGTYDTKAAINESWTENYGAGGVPDGPNITFTVTPNATVTFTYVAATHLLSVSATAATTDTTTAITADDPDPSTVGQAVTIRYRVTPVSGTGTPTGTVTVSDGTDSCTGTVADGQCVLTFTTAGTRYLTATYSGDNGFNGSTSAVETHTVNPTNTAPTAIVTGGQCSTLNSAGGLLNLTLSDADGDPLTLTLASNSNPALLPNSSILLGGSGANRTMTVTTAARTKGSTTIVLNLSDGKVTVPVVVTVIIGTDRNETLNGTSGTDIIFGLAGANTINGNAGNDLLCGGNSNDTINGGDGDDIIDGENGNDILSGGNGADTLRGGNGNDTLTGGAGPDRFSGGPGTDTATDLTAAQADTQDGTIP
jgi:hypothetical protein